MKLLNVQYDLEFCSFLTFMNNMWQRFDSFMDALRDILEER